MGRAGDGEGDGADASLTRSAATGTGGERPRTYHMPAPPSRATTSVSATTNSRPPSPASHSRKPPPMGHLLCRRGGGAKDGTRGYRHAPYADGRAEPHRCRRS